MLYTDYQNKNLNLYMLSRFTGFHLCKMSYYVVLCYQLRKKINLYMLLETNNNILCKNQIRIQNMY